MHYPLLMTAGAGLLLLLVGSLLGQSSLTTNLQSLILVLGGTAVCGLMAFPLQTVRDMLTSLRLAMRPESMDVETLIEQIKTLARIRRTQGPRELSAASSTLDNLFLRKGIDLVVDDYDRHRVCDVMEKEFELYFSRRESQISILNTLARLAPAFGFVGTVIGLINVLASLQDPLALGRSMSLALYTTLYGLLLSNFLFLPLARKLTEHTKQEETLLKLILEGVMDIAETKNPWAVSHRLKSYVGISRMTSARGIERPVSGAPSLLRLLMARVFARGSHE
jgi:chemotaxis protein MotA